MLIELFLQEIFNSLDIMISRCFDSFHSLSIFKREICEYFVQICLLLNNVLYVLLVGGGNLLLKESFEPFEFHKDTILHQCVLRKEASQFMTLSRISSIYGWYSCQLWNLIDLCRKHHLLNIEHVRAKILYLSSRGRLHIFKEIVLLVRHYYPLWLYLTPSDRFYPRVSN